MVAEQHALQANLSRCIATQRISHELFSQRWWASFEENLEVRSSVLPIFSE